MVIFVLVVLMRDKPAAHGPTFTSECAIVIIIYTVSQKKVLTFKLSVTLSNLNRQTFKIFALLESAWNLLQNPNDITHLTLGMLLHYLGKSKIEFFCRCGRKRKQSAFLIASNFVIHPQIFIFSVFKIPSLSRYWNYWLQIKLSISLFFYLFTFMINLWHRLFVTADVTAVFVNNQHDIQWWRQDFDKKSLHLKGYTVRRLTDEFSEKSWTKLGVNKLLKKLRDTGTVHGRPGSGRPRSEKKIAMPSYA